MLAPHQVLGPDAHPLFKELANQAGSPNWNFNKYLLDRNGKVVQRFDSGTEPMSSHPQCHRNGTLTSEATWLPGLYRDPDQLDGCSPMGQPRNFSDHSPIAGFLPDGSSQQPKVGPYCDLNEQPLRRQESVAWTPAEECLRPPSASK